MQSIGRYIFPFKNSTQNPKTKKKKNKKKPKNKTSNNNNNISTEYEVQRRRLTAKPFFKVMVARKEDDGL